jgi:hypothetical protein
MIHHYTWKCSPKGTASFPEDFSFLAVSLWVPRIFQHVYCLCDTLLTGWGGLALIYHIWLDLTVMQWYCCTKHAVLWDLLSSCVLSVVCLFMSFEHILTSINKMKVTFLPVSSLLCTRVAYHPVLPVWLSLNSLRNKEHSVAKIIITTVFAGCSQDFVISHHNLDIPIIFAYCCTYMALI